MRLRQRGTMLAAGLLPIGLLAQPASEAALRKGKATYEAVCGSCHSVSIADGLRDEKEWKDTIEVMQGIGAKGSPEQFDQVIRYLLSTQTRVNVNSGSAAQIAPVLDITPAAAEGVVKWREEKGPIKNIDELRKAAGVDAAKLDTRKDRIVF